jgi:transposase
LAAFLGLVPSEDSSDPRRRLGAITKTGNGRARHALIEGAWAYRHPAKVSEHLQRRTDTLPKSSVCQGNGPQHRVGAVMQVVLDRNPRQRRG